MKQPMGIKYPADFPRQLRFTRHTPVSAAVQKTRSFLGKMGEFQEG